MNFRSYVQILSVIVVVSILFFHFEIQTLRTANDSLVYVLESSGFSGVLNEVDNIVLDHGIDKVEIVEYVTPIEDELDFEDMNAGNEKLNELNHNEIIVQYSKDMRLCTTFSIMFILPENIDYDRTIDIMEKLFVNVTCTHPDNETMVFSKTLPVFPDYDAPKKLQAIFFPDESTGYCSVKTYSVDGIISLSGDLKKEYTVMEMSPTYSLKCWDCKGIIFN